MITHWNCQICKKKRPDAKISVLSYPMRSFLGATINTKYCNDDLECYQGAVEKREKGEI